MINSLGEVVMPDSTWTNWQVHIPKSLITDSSYEGIVYGFIFEETKSICIVDDPLYFSSERVVGYIGTSAPVWPQSVIEKYSKTTFFTGKFTDHIIEGYVISNNSAFGAHPKKTRENCVKSVADVLEIMQARELEEVGRATIIPYLIINTAKDSAEYWNAYVPDSILSNPMFCGAIYGNCLQNSVFIFDTVKFPEKKNEKYRIGYIIGNSDDTSAAIAVLRNDGSDIIVGEFIDSKLRLRLQNEGTHADGTGWKDEEYTRIVIHKREESDSLISEEIAALKFRLSPDIEVYVDNEGTILIPADSEASVLHTNSPTNSDYFKPSNIINQDGTCLNPEDLAVKGSSTENAIEALRNQLVGGNETDDIGFKPVDLLIEPWFTPDWVNLDATVLFYENSDEFQKEEWLEFYKKLKEWVIECPTILDIANSMEGLWWGDTSRVRDISQTLPAKILSYVIAHHADYELYDAHEFVSALCLLAALLKNHIVRLDTEGELF